MQQEQAAYVCDVDFPEQRCYNGSCMPLASLYRKALTQQAMSLPDRNLLH